MDGKWKWRNGVKMQMMEQQKKPKRGGGKELSGLVDEMMDRRRKGGKDDDEADLLKLEQEMKSLDLSNPLDTLEEKEEVYEGSKKNSRSGEERREKVSKGQISLLPNNIKGWDYYRKRSGEFWENMVVVKLHILNNVALKIKSRSRFHF